MPDSLVSEINRVTAALIDVLQRHENEIHRLKILNTALAATLRESQIHTGLSSEQAEELLRRALADAEQNAPSQEHSNLEKEIQELLKEAARLHKLNEEQNKNAN